ncbi:uncharacterized protein C4orf19 homolog [Talpa occidentalis]|uniref:uncharacterized protein C4orf19 homolog n=1 Tax=Talpa occidentalis TaxID=50954 RepID=UPI00188FD9F6|nr:uncharacterized protein C4orf19 homolog [Talpa occidentalis]XP_054544167.1 uncharacterized protein C4orf19 homolog [Talpa occidentalis]
MGCRCCKMIQSYLFDPVQVSSPGYVNEVNGGKLDEDDTGKLKGRQTSQASVHQNDLPSEHLQRICSQNRTATGAPSQGDTEWGLGAGKTGGALNGIGPTPQPTGDPGPHQDDKGSWASTENSVHPTEAFLEAGNAREQDCEQPFSEEGQVILNGDSRAPTTVLEAQDHVLQIPPPDYPQPWGPTVDNMGHGLVEGIHLEKGDHYLDLPFSLKRSWDSLNEAVATDLLSIYFKEEAPTHVTPVVDSRNGWGDTHSPPGDSCGEVADEDAAVAEALAALEAATAGEDVDEADWGESGGHINERLSTCEGVLLFRRGSEELPQAVPVQPCQ